MGWTTAEGEHEGHAAYVVSDGRMTGTSSGTGVLIRREDADAVAQAAAEQGRAPRDDELYDLVVWADVIGWQVLCECGWRGPTWDRATTVPTESGYADAEAAYLPDGTTVEDAAQEAWREHVAPHSARTDLCTAAHEATAARRRLDDAVHTARSYGVTWAQIGADVGLTRQAAHERWGQPKVSTPPFLSD